MNLHHRLHADARDQKKRRRPHRLATYDKLYAKILAGLKE
jgi:hypothetical protein